MKNYDIFKYFFGLDHDPDYPDREYNIDELAKEMAKTDLCPNDGFTEVYDCMGCEECWKKFLGRDDGLMPLQKRKKA